MNEIYQDASLGAHINVVLVRIVMLCSAKVSLRPHHRLTQRKICGLMHAREAARWLSGLGVCFKPLESGTGGVYAVQRIRVHVELRYNLIHMCELKYLKKFEEVPVW